MLSPFTFWNDAFVNIPISYLCANLLMPYLRIGFLNLVIICYWATNGLGVVIMFLSGKNILGEEKVIKHALIRLFGTLAIYSFVLIALGRLGILKPVALH